MKKLIERDIQNVLMMANNIVYDTNKNELSEIGKKDIAAQLEKMLNIVNHQIETVISDLNSN